MDNKAVLIAVVAALAILLLSGCTTPQEQQNATNGTHAQPPPAFNQSGMQDGKCGDGTCDSVEKAHPGTCPQDCGNSGESQNNRSAGDITYETPSVADGAYDFRALASGLNFSNVLKLFNPALDTADQKLYVTGTKSTYMDIIDLNTRTIVDSWNTGLSGGYLFYYNDSLYMLQIGSVNKYYRVDLSAKKTYPASFERSFKPGDSPNTYGGYTFKEVGYMSFPDGKTGFPTNWTQDLNGAYGIIQVYDSAGTMKGQFQFPGPDSLYLNVDNTTGLLYTTNTGDGSISVFNVSNLEQTNFCANLSCLLERNIDVGDSADGVLADSSGNIYVRNRLGGSVIYKYDPASGSFMTINNVNYDPDGIDMWPTGMELSKDGSRLYVLSHYGASIDVVNTSSGKVTQRMQFDTPLKPRTDSISALAMDEGEGLYAVWPELGLIGIADGASGEIKGMINLSRYGFDISKAANAGPGRIKLAADKNTGSLYVMISDTQQLLVFDTQTLEKKGELSDLGSVVLDSLHNTSTFFLDAAHGSIYVNSQMFDAATLEPKGAIPAGIKGAIIAVDADGTLYTAETKGHQEYVYKIVSNSVAKKLVMDETLSVPNTYYVDTENDALYTAYFEAGTVKKYSFR